MSILDTIKEYSFVNEIHKNGGEVYVVGGSLRDELLNRPIKDLDLLICKIPFDKLNKLLREHGHTNLVGKAFGIIKFFPHEDSKFELDIALPRKEASTGQGHKDFHVDFDESIPVKEDLLRRDFTINAIAKNIITGEVIDPTNGIKDLDSKIIRAVFDNSFKEDPLRLLRAIQFTARLGFTIEEGTFKQIIESVDLIDSIAKERIIVEIKKLFSAEKPSLGFDLMRDTGLLKHVFPDVQKMIGVTQPNKNNEDVYAHTMKVLDAARSADELEKSGDLQIMFAALFHDAGKPKTKREDEESKRVTFFNHQHISTGIAWRWLKDYRATTVGINPHHVCHLVKHHMFETKPFEDNDKALRRFISKVGKENIFDLIDLRLSDKKGGRFPNKVYGMLKLRERIHEEINRKVPFSAKDLAVTGYDIIQLGHEAGPIIGEIQKFLVQKVLDEPNLNTKEDLLNLIKEFDHE
jgi:tRNA nucleotidyltransferase (CCA-adding enzyme)